MGQCGCGDYAGRWRMPGPDGKWYVLTPYQSCPDCSTPAGVSIDLMSEEDMKDWDAQHLRVICDDTFPNSCVPMIDLDVLQKALLKSLKAAGIKLPGDRFEREEVLSELNLYGLIQGVVWETAKKYDRDLVEAHKRVLAEERRRRAEEQAKAEDALFGKPRATKHRKAASNG